jgi:predicted acylesterase/phospholipase RssA
MFDTVVLSGGGPCVITFVGCLRYLEHVGVASGVKTWVGTSAGAIMALLACAGMDSAAMLAWLEEGVRTGDLVSLDADGILDFPERLGLDDGERILDCLRGALSGLIGAEDATFRDFAKTTGRHLVVCAANVTKVRQEFFSVDTTPDVTVLTAVRMSFGIPLIFTPVSHAGCFYVDGGMFDNCPVDFLTASPRNATSALVLRIQLYSPETSPAMSVPAGVCDYLWLLVRAMIVRANQAAAVPVDESDGGSRVKVRVVNIGGEEAESQQWGAISMETLSFVVDESTVTRCVQMGYDAVQAELGADVALSVSAAHQHET